MSIISVPNLKEIETWEGYLSAFNKNTLNVISQDE